MATCPHCDFQDEPGTPCPNHATACCVDEEQLALYKDQGLLLGHIIAERFAAFQVLGKGGMGWVYEASQLPIGRKIALKVLRSDYVNDEIVRSRFFREARVLGMLAHPNLVTLHDYGVTSHEGEESLYIAMELLRGRTLTAALKRPKLLKAPRLLGIARGIAGGLAEAHRNGVVHRDLKPDNVLLVRDAMRQEVTKLVDFGIARLSTANTVLTKTGMVFGTPAYMSPEQATGDSSVGTAADVYAFGVLLYRMLTGKLPFTGDVPLQLLMMHINKPPPRIELRSVLHVPRDLLDLTYACLEKKPESRPQDGAELERELSRIGVLLQEGQFLVSSNSSDSPAVGDGPSQDDISTKPSIDTEPSPPPAMDGEDDTVVFGGDFEVLRSDSIIPDTSVDGQKPKPMETDPDASKAYRKAPVGGPAPLRAQEQSKSPVMLIALVLVALAVVVGLAVALMGGDDDSDKSGAEPDNEAGVDDEADEDNAQDDGSDEAPVNAGGTDPSAPEGADSEGADPDRAPVPTDRAAEIKARITDLELDRETLLTIVDAAERNQRDEKIGRELDALKAELEALERR